MSGRVLGVAFFFFFDIVIFLLGNPGGCLSCISSQLTSFFFFCNIFCISVGYTFFGTFSCHHFHCVAGILYFIFYFYGFYFLITRSYGLSSRQKGNVSAEHVVKDCMGYVIAIALDIRFSLPPFRGDGGVQGKITILLHSSITLIFSDHHYYCHPYLKRPLLLLPLLLLLLLLEQYYLIYFTLAGNWTLRIMCVRALLLSTGGEAGLVIVG